MKHFNVKSRCDKITDYARQGIPRSFLTFGYERISTDHGD